MLVRDGSGRCAAHPKQAWTKTTPTKRRAGRWLQRERQRLFERDPLCAECKRLGRITLATERDHIKPLAEGGADDDTNVQGLCAPCHEAKRKEESARGLARRRQG